jgi:arylsulfatase A-like enzyme
MSGWYPHVRGHRTMHHMLHHEAGESTLLEALRERGYHVFWGGKNDLVPGQWPKDRYAETRGDPSRYELDPNWHGPVYQEARGEPGQDSFYSFFIGRMDKRSDATFYQDNDWAHVQEAIRLIRNPPDDRPLCLYLPLVYPHPPYGVEEPFFSAIDRKALPPRIHWPARDGRLPAMMRCLRENFGMQDWSEQRWDELRATYYGMCMRMDALLGELIDALKETGNWDDSALFLFSDHGDFTGDYGLVEKTQNTFQDCLTRVPFIIKPPKGVVCQPGVRDCLTELIDFPATVEALTGCELGHDHFGRSLLPVIAGDRREHRDAVFCEGGRLRHEVQCMEHLDPQPGGAYYPRSKEQRYNHVAHSKAVMCRTRDFKYVRRMYEQDEFYDLRSDTGEVDNRIDDPRYRDEILAHKERLMDFFLETGDVVPRALDER